MGREQFSIPEDTQDTSAADRTALPSMARRARRTRLVMLMGLSVTLLLAVTGVFAVAWLLVN